ncbi:MAG: IclR family transcriptional regulator [Kiloniellaceae bacterium]
MPTVTKSLGDGTQSVLLTVEILERLAAQDGPVSISDLARDIGTSKSRIFRHLQTLVACDYVASPATSGEYQVGKKLLAFCRSINERYDLVTVAQPIMTDLRNHFGHTVILSRVDSAGLVVLKTTGSDSPISIGIRPGTPLPFDGSAQGKIAMAFLPAARRTGGTALARAYKALAASHPEELAAVTRHEWATGHIREGLFGLAAPVFARNGLLIATLALLDTRAMMGDDAGERKGAYLRDAARRLSHELDIAGIQSA